MSFTLDFTALLLVFAVAVGLSVITLAAAVGTLVVENRPVRLARRESIPTYYGHLLLGH